MFQIAFTLLSVFLLINFCDVKDMYDMGVDDVFSSVLGPIYNVKKTTHTFKINLSTENTIAATTPRRKLIFLNQPDSSDNATEKNDYYVTRHKRRRRKVRPGFLTKANLDIEALIAPSQDKPIPDFNVDPFKVLSRRFDNARSQFTQYRAKQALREEYFQYEYVDLIKKEKVRLLSVMEQFVYESRYKLVYAQKLRKKYRRKVIYQLGYCFALMRNMKQDQYVLFSSMHIHRENYTNFLHVMKMYERIVRLDIDLKDMIKFVKYLDYIITFHNFTERPKG